MNSLLQEKKNEDISKMFDEISPQYDFLNHFLSFGIDKLWRKKLIKMLRKEGATKILDVATGTVDLAIYSSRFIPDSHITGIDISAKMLEVGRQKVNRLDLSKQIELMQMPAERMTFEDNTFDGAMVAFGVRNFESLEGGLNEMLRVLKPETRFFILEFSKPGGAFGQVFKFYFKFILPFIGRLVSRNKVAYAYLFDSVMDFPQGDKFLKIMEKCGSSQNVHKRLSGGIATIYIGQKKKIT
jgi:demethylmenaquinone methyltransferase / 2-methoxy-6-polyprenyl-1,4-benzoquinol methylase